MGTTRTPEQTCGGRVTTHSHLVTGTLAGQTTSWMVPEEVPVALQINSVPHAVMMATPADLQDFALGFLLSEGLIATAGDVAGLLVFPSGEGHTVDLAVPEDKLIRERIVSRSMEGRVGCGLCGVTEMENAIHMSAQKLSSQPLNAASVEQAFRELPEHQPMNSVNRTVHAAAWCNGDGHIICAREDVGRHTALDKLIGALAKSTVNPHTGFVVMSSRCSFELVQKCAMVGIGALATISAPTALAYRMAKSVNLQLAAMSQHGVMIFDGDE